MKLFIAATILFSVSAHADEQRVLMSDGSVCIISSRIVLRCDRERAASARVLRELPPTAEMIADAVEKRSPEYQERVQAQRDTQSVRAEEEWDRKQRMKAERAAKCVLPVGNPNYVNLTGEPKYGCRWIGKYGEKCMGECPCEGDSGL